MLYFYKRGLEDFRIETSFDDTAKEYVLTLHQGLHNERVERFADTFSFRNRLDALDRELIAQQWQHVGRPGLLKDGWKI